MEWTEHQCDMQRYENFSKRKMQVKSMETSSHDVEGIRGMLDQ